MLDVDKTECGVYVGFVFRCDREIPPMELIFGEVLEVIFEFLEAEPRLSAKGVVGMDVGLVWVCRGRRGCRHEDEERVRG